MKTLLAILALSFSCAAQTISVAPDKSALIVHQLVTIVTQVSTNVSTNSITITLPQLRAAEASLTNQAAALEAQLREIRSYQQVAKALGVTETNSIAKP